MNKLKNDWMNYIFPEQIILLHAKNIQNNNRSWTASPWSRFYVCKELEERKLGLTDYPKRLIADINSKCKGDGR